MKSRKDKIEKINPEVVELEYNRRGEVIAGFGKLDEVKELVSKINEIIDKLNEK